MVFPPSIHTEYYLEDVVQMLGFVPMSQSKRGKNNKNNMDDDEDVADKEDDVSAIPKAWFTTSRTIFWSYNF